MIKLIIASIFLLGYVIQAKYSEITSGKVAQCEYEILRYATEIADAFNAPIGKQNWNQRTIQDIIVERIGFAPWVANGVHGTNGKTLSGNNARDIHTSKGWIGKNISESPYSILNHKWVYMYGDSTTRQIWASYAAPFQGNSFERNAKEWTRQYCNRQPHRIHHPKGGDFPEEGWRGPCGINEVTCYVSGYGDEGLLTFDWKHFPYEDYDDYLWGESGLFKANSTERLPDILTVQYGLHSCWHAHPTGLYSSHLSEVNKTMLSSHIDGISKLMKSIRQALSRRPDANTTVIILTSGVTYQHHGEAMDDCIQRFNRITANAAHEQGFPVLERGEIERRMMFKAMHMENPFIHPEIHLSQPIQNIVATCLLQLLNCLNDKGLSDASYDYLGYNNNEKFAPPPRPQHSP